MDSTALLCYSTRRGDIENSMETANLFNIYLRFRFYYETNYAIGIMSHTKLSYDLLVAFRRASFRSINFAKDKLF